MYHGVNFLKSKLRDYQIEGIKFCLDVLKTEKSVYLSDDTGLGKTVQALLVINKLAKKKDLFCVVCPVFLKEKWLDEIEKHLGKNLHFTIQILSYSELINEQTLRYYCKNRYKLIVFDEAHYMNSFESQRTKAILGNPNTPKKSLSLISCTEKSLWLSATPSKGKFGELYPFLNLVNSDLAKNLTYTMFIMKYANFYRIMNYGVIYKDLRKDFREKFKNEIDKFLLRRDKYDVIEEMPSYNIDLLPISTPKKIQNLDEKFLKLFKTSKTDFDFSDIYNDFSEGEKNILEYNSNVLPSFTEYSAIRKKQSLVKIPIVIKYFKELHSNKNLPKCVIFTYHYETALQVYEEIKKFRKQNVFLISGRDNPNKRFAKLKEIESYDDSILVCTMNSIKEGYDLVSFCNVFYLEIDWTFSLIEQTKGRFLRIGQENFVNYFFLLYNSGIEKYIFETYQSKKEFFHSVIQAKKPKKSFSKIDRKSFLF